MTKSSCTIYVIELYTKILGNIPLLKRKFPKIICAIRNIISHNIIIQKLCVCS